MINKETHFKKLVDENTPRSPIHRPAPKLDELSSEIEILETGCVAVNTPVVAVAEAPFGGIKQTGYGREGGSNAIKDYLNVKYTHMGIKG